MVIYIFTNKEAALKKAFAKNAVFRTIAALSKHSSEEGDILYVDVTGFTGPNLKKTLTQLKKSCKVPWGIIDPKGSVKDTASLFFMGASDYLGSDFFKQSKYIDPKRIKAAVLWRGDASIANPSAAKKDAKSGAVTESARLPKTGIKFPSVNTFPGWKKIQSGKTMPFFLLYCSFMGKKKLDTRMDEKTIGQVHNRFMYYLVDIFSESDGLLWMDSGADCLFLLPPRAKSVQTAIKACIRMIISAPLVTLETLAIRIPVNFIFGLHYGSINYNPPGRTGTIASDAVNFVFHLGTKKAEPGRLTISGELPDGTIPESLEDCFISVKEFEGRKIWQTKKFDYIRPWV